MPASPGAGAATVRLRQRHRADQHGDPALVPGAADRMALHRAGQTAAERLHRELQRSAAGRTAQRDAVYLAGSGQGRAGDLAARLQQIGRATSELQSLMRISYAVFCLKKKKKEN